MLLPVAATAEVQQPLLDTQPVPKTTSETNPTPMPQPVAATAKVRQLPLDTQLVVNPNTQPFCRECQNTGGVCQIDTNKNNKLGYLNLQIGGFLIKALIDTGASVSVMGQSLFTKIAPCDPQAILTIREPKNHGTVTLADGKTVPVLTTARLEVQTFDETIDETFHILQDTHTTILGWPFYANNDLTIDCKRRLLIRENCIFQINAVFDSDTKSTQPRTTLDLCLTQTITIPPRTSRLPIL